MSSPFVAVNAPGSFGSLAGGGGKDPRKPGGSAPGRGHYEEPTLSRRQIKNTKKKAALAARALEGVESDSEELPTVASADDSDVEIVEERKVLGEFRAASLRRRITFVARP